jgi:hypothetical protein
VKQAFAFLGHLRDPLVELNRDLIADGADHVSDIVCRLQLGVDLFLFRFLFRFLSRLDWLLMLRVVELFDHKHLKLVVLLLELHLGC